MVETLEKYIRLNFTITQGGVVLDEVRVSCNVAINRFGCCGIITTFSEVAVLFAKSQVIIINQEVVDVAANIENREIIEGV